MPLGRSIKSQTTILDRLDRFKGHQYFSAPEEKVPAAQLVKLLDNFKNYLTLHKDILMHSFTVIKEKAPNTGAEIESMMKDVIPKEHKPTFGSPQRVDLARQNHKKGSTPQKTPGKTSEHPRQRAERILNPRRSSARNMTFSHEKSPGTGSETRHLSSLANLLPVAQSLHPEPSFGSPAAPSVAPPAALPVKPQTPFPLGISFMASPPTTAAQDLEQLLAACPIGPAPKPVALQPPVQEASSKAQKRKSFSSSSSASSGDVLSKIELEAAQHFTGTKHSSESLPTLFASGILRKRKQEGQSSRQTNSASYLPLAKLQKAKEASSSLASQGKLAFVPRAVMANQRKKQRTKAPSKAPSEVPSTTFKSPALAFVPRAVMANQRKKQRAGMK